MLAELIADSARYFQTYSNYSMSYLLGLLIEKLAQVTKDLKKDRNTSLDITDVVSECAIDLTDPISEILKETAEKREARLSNSKAIQEKAAKEAVTGACGDGVKTENVCEKVFWALWGVIHNFSSENSSDLGHYFLASPHKT